MDLSVVIAAFDAARTLDQQLAALSRQRVDATWEVLIADNGSTDGTRELAAAWADRLPRLRVIDASARRGAGAARNIGVEAATGRDVVFCDADDVVADEWLAAMHRALTRHSLVAGRFDGTLLNTDRVRRSRTLPQQDGLQHTDPFPAWAHAGAGNLGMRRELFRAVGGFDPDALFLEDTDLCWRLRLAGVPVAWVPDALVHVRLRGTLRSAFGQGYHYGSGEHWLARRYRDQVTATGAATSREPAVPARSAVPTAASGAATAASCVTAGPVGRLLHRGGVTLRALTRVRSLGDLGAWCWDLGFGLGYAFAPLDDPEPVRVTSSGDPRSAVA